MKKPQTIKMKKSLNNRVNEDGYDAASRALLTILGRNPALNSGTDRQAQYNDFIRDFKERWKMWYAGRKDKKAHFNTTLTPESKTFLDSAILSESEYHKLNAIFESIVHIDAVNEGLFTGDEQYKSNLMDRFVAHYYPDIWAQFKTDPDTYNGYVQERNKWAGSTIETLFGGLDNLIRYLFTLYEQTAGARAAQQNTAAQNTRNTNSSKSNLNQTSTNFDARQTIRQFENHLIHLKTMDPDATGRSSVYDDILRAYDRLINDVKKSRQTSAQAGQNNP